MLFSEVSEYRPLFPIETIPSMRFIANIHNPVPQIVQQL
jgi:hypothetical protein